MPSNKNLIESINKVATEKGVEIPNTVGLSNDKLNATLKELRALEVKPAESNESTEESEALVPGADESTEVKTDESTEVKTDPEAAEKLEKEAEENLKKETEKKAQKIKDDRLKAEKAVKEQAKKEAKAKQDAIPPYRIAPGKSLTSKKGVLDEGDEVKAEYFSGGQETLDHNVDRGFIIKK